MEKCDEKYIIVQSNPLIEAQYKLDLLPQKIVRYLVSKIKPDHHTFEDCIFYLSMSDFVSITDRDYSGKTIEDVKSAAEKLLKTQITITRGKEITRTNWLASYKYHVDEAWFEFSFSAHLERELLKIKDQFTQYHLSNISKVKSQYSIRIYELLKQYLSIGYRKIMVEELKAILGIDKDEYKLFGKFKQGVLNPAYNEIIKKTDLEFNWRPIKQVRKVVGVEFYDILQKINVSKTLIELLPKKYRVNKDILLNIRKWLELKGEYYVKEKILYTDSRKPSNWADYFYQCLEKDYGAGYDLAQTELPLEDKSKKVEVRDGVKIEINGVTYVIEDGFVRTETGIIPTGIIREGIRSGEFKVIDVDGE